MLWFAIQTRLERGYRGEVRLYAKFKQNLQFNAMFF
jgi:hypothetical protein